LVESHESLSRLGVDPLLLAGSLAQLQLVVLIIDRVNEDGRLRTLVLEEVSYYLVSHARIPRVRVHRQLEALEQVCCLELVPQLVLDVILELLRLAPDLSTLVEEAEVGRGHLVLGHNYLVHLLAHHGLHEVGERSHLRVELVVVVQL